VGWGDSKVRIMGGERVMIEIMRIKGSIGRRVIIGVGERFRKRESEGWGE
jgi:hypothetical protein